MTKRYILPQELSEYLGISLQAIYEWTSQKRIPHIKLGRLVKFDIIEGDRWLLSQRIEPYG
ncbi:MAG: helix-turn-helix domain-containing protein [Candidatus Omnitrophica bacterium]|nr:helix-turn-helix domain-containing protein [Candidatus Omnitrophota bacterium]